MKVQQQDGNTYFIFKDGTIAKRSATGKFRHVRSAWHRVWNDTKEKAQKRYDDMPEAVYKPKVSNYEKEK